MINEKQYSKIMKLGVGLTLLAALSAFAVRAAEAQVVTPPPASSTGQPQPVGPQRLSLGEAARMAAAQSASVEGAGYRVQEAQARVKEARAATLPQVSFAPNWSSHTINSASFGFSFPTPAGEKPLLDPKGQIIGPVKQWDFRGSVSQSIYDPATQERVRAARANVTAASADVRTVAEDAATNAAAAYVRAQRADATVQARVADSVLARELLGIAQDQLEAGVGVGLDVTRAQSQVAAARAQLIAARNDRNRARLDLLRALNLPLDTPVELTDSLSTMQSEGATVDVAVAAALRERPEMRTLDAQLAAAQQQAAAIRATRLPTVSAFANDGPNGFIDNLLNTYTYGVQLSVPVFEGGRRSAQTQEQQAVANGIEVRRRDLRQQIESDVRTALLDLSSAREQVDAARERERLAELEVQQARDRFRAGVAGNADVATASQTLNTARTAVIDALTQYQAARVSLARAEGNVTQLR
jgi:outer membrane protein TolC